MATTTKIMVFFLFTFNQTKAQNARFVVYDDTLPLDAIPDCAF
jgi:hypothetical protein